MNDKLRYLKSVLLVFAISVGSGLWAQDRESTHNPGALKFGQSAEAGKPNKIPAIPGLTAAPTHGSTLTQALSQSGLVPDSLRGGARNLLNFDKSASKLASALSADPALSKVTQGASTNRINVKGLSGAALRTGDDQILRLITSRNSKEFLPLPPDRK